jgi:hypothetical protein
MTSYVHENTEVVLTGRRAEREVGGRGRRTEPRIDELVEITPADKEDGSWKKFVRMTDLYKITDKQPE